MKTFFIALTTLLSVVLYGQEVELATSKWDKKVGVATIENDVFILGSNGRVVNGLSLQPKSRYRVSAMVKCGSGAEEVVIQIIKGHTLVASAVSPLVDWKQITFYFQTYLDAEKGYRIELAKSFSSTGAQGWFKDVKIERVGDAVAEVRHGFHKLPERQVKVDLGISQQPNEKIDWFTDAKLGLFVHWGIYAGPAKGEWMMENRKIPIDEYRKYAYPESGDEQFLADKYDPTYWADIAKAAGMKYAQFTTQHHDGYAMFHSKYNDVFSSYATHNRDLTREYVDAFRQAGLRIGLYKTLINWRYPGYYDATGTDCAPNKWGYTTQSCHKENARQMKEELFCMTKELMSNYGKIDAIFWDGGWLAQRGSDKDAAYFWETGKHLDPDNSWPIDHKYTEFDPHTGKPLGLMGMVRKLQPDIITNIRAGWIGDFDNDEGGALISGPIRSETIIEKCMSLHPGWGYSTAAEDSLRIWSVPRLKKLFSDCLIRNMNLLVNVGPDRHGNITKAEENVLRNFGRWVKSVEPAVYGTRGGPWNPEDEEFGFTYKDNVIYLYIYNSYDLTDGFVFPSIDDYKIVRVYDVKTNSSVKYRKIKGGEYQLRELDHTDDVVTVLAIELNRNIKLL